MPVKPFPSSPGSSELMTQQRLVAGQNTEIGSTELTFTVLPTRVTTAALILNDRHRTRPDTYLDATSTSSHPGVHAHHRQLSIHLDTVAAEVTRVRCVALDPQPHTDALVCTLADDRGQSTTFIIPAVDVHPAMIAFELYRRGPRWKVRAVGQGYAGGTPELTRAHGIPVTQTLTTPRGTPTLRTTASAAMPVPTAVPITPLNGQNPLERIAMIYEDAARSTAALLAARNFADNRRDTEMTAAIADPATRNTTASQQAIIEAQRRHDDLITTATADYQRDAAHLITELAALDNELPSALASWTAPAWQHTPQPATGIRLGLLTMPEAGPLSVPLCLSTPIRRPLWIDTREPGAATPVLAAILTRLLAAAPHTPCSIDVIDLADALSSLTRHLQVHMPRNVVTTNMDVAERLQRLITLAELAALNQAPVVNQSGRGIVVITDPGYGFPPEAIQATAQLINNAAATAIEVVFVGDHADAGSSSSILLREIAEHSHHVRVDFTDSMLLDPWTHNAWRFVPDSLSPGPRLADILDKLPARQHDHGDEAPW